MNRFARRVHAAAEAAHTRKTTTKQTDNLRRPDMPDQTLTWAGRTVEWQGIAHRIGRAHRSNFYVTVRVIASPFPRELGALRTVRADTLTLNVHA